MQTNIIRGNQVLAEMVSDGEYEWSWRVNVPNPSPGPAVWKAPNGAKVPIQILNLAGDWLVFRRSNGLLAGVTWKTGEYWLNWLRDAKGKHTDKLTNGCYVDGGEGYATTHVLPKKWWR